MLDASHARLVHSVIRGRACHTNAPEHVMRSWRRCLDEYGLEPDSDAQPPVVAQQELMVRKERNLELVSFADTEMAWLYRQLAGSGHSIILTDRDGVLLSYYGDPNFKGAASRAGLLPGAVWSEQHGGTNGMGTCLNERVPLIVHRDQHFLARNTALTCCAAPIFDPRGGVAAVLDASAESDRAQSHTLVLVNMSAQTIEKRLFLHCFRDAFVVRFHSRPELVGTWSEGLIALNHSGLIVAADRNALLQLGGIRAEEVLNAPVERVFNLALPALIGRKRRKSFRPLPVYEARQGSRFFAVAQEPESSQGAARATQAEPGSASLASVSSGALDELDLGDPAMARNIRAAKRIASRPVPVLLVGETGSGKERFARALHAASERYGEPFIAVNCASVSAALLEAKIAQACRGTLFLDEVGELAGALQARLLDVLERREVTASAGETPLPLDPRVLAASTCALEEKVRRGEFREDLFYRLQGLVLTLPRLHERADKRALVKHLFAQEAADTPSVSLSERLIDALCAYRWPGNILQLRNTLRAMIARRSYDKLDLTDLPPDCSGVRAADAEDAPGGTAALNALGKAERAALVRELELERGNISHVARNLGVSRNAIYRKMHRLRIAWPTSKAR